MKIGIDIRSTLKKPTGIGQYTLGLLRGLSNIDKENSYYLYCRKELLSRHKKVPRIETKNFKIVNDRFNKGVSNIMPDIDIFFSPSADFLDTADIPVVVNILDLRFKAYPEFYDKEHINYRDEVIKRVLKKASAVTCISESTKNDLIKFYSDCGASDNIKVIYPAVNKDIFNLRMYEEKKGKVLQKNKIAVPYILNVGTVSRIKNSALILRTFYEAKKKTNFPHKLVFVGAVSRDYSLEELLSDAELNRNILNDVIFTGYGSDENLACIYKGADIFIFPSLHEGFGIPIVEAFACGVPVITSNTSSCSEVASDAAIKINPENIDEAVKSLTELTSNESLRKELSVKGIRRSKDFNWGESAKDILEVLKTSYEEH